MFVRNDTADETKKAEKHTSARGVLPAAHQTAVAIAAILARTFATALNSLLTASHSCFTVVRG